MSIWNIESRLPPGALSHGAVPETTTEIWSAGRRMKSITPWNTCAVVPSGTAHTLPTISTRKFSYS